MLHSVAEDRTGYIFGSKHRRNARVTFLCTGEKAMGRHDVITSAVTFEHFVCSNVNQSDDSLTHVVTRSSSSREL